MQSENKQCVVVLFGGLSSEHEVSCVSASTIVANLDRARYEVLTVGITKEGRWLYTEATPAQMADGSWEELPGNMPCVLSPDRADHGMILFTPAGQVEKLPVDVVIPALHGLWGEDGTVQGLLELAYQMAFRHPLADRDRLRGRVQLCRAEAGLAHLRQARQCRLQRGHLQGPRSG